MKTLLNTKLNVTKGLAVVLLGLGITLNSNAQNKCINLFNADSAASSSSSGTAILNKINGSDFKLKDSVLEKIAEVYADEGIQSNSNKARDVVEAAYKVIRGNSSAPSMEKSDKLAKISRKILTTAKAKLSEKEFLMLNYLYAEAVLRLEQIKESDFQTEKEDVLEASNVLHISQFHKYVESYVDGTALYKNFGGNGGILSWPDIRTLYANNNWVVAFKHHDMYHLHYSYGHPFYLAVNFLTSRSINDFRYHVMSSLWESVDTVRTGYEDSIADYFRKRGMTSQEGMLHIATASRAELKKIENAMNNGNSYYQERWESDMEDGTKYSNSWKPTKSKRFRTAMPTTATFYKELEAYLNESLALIANPAKTKYVNFDRNANGNPSDVDVTEIP